MSNRKKGGVVAYAIHRRANGKLGGTHGAVKKAIDSGRLSDSVSWVNRGSTKAAEIDFALADAEWDARTDPAQAERSLASIYVPIASVHPPLPPPTVHAPAPTFPDESTIEAIEEASGASWVEAAAWIVQLFKLDPIIALHCVEIAFHEQCSAFEDEHGLMSGPLHPRGDMKAVNDPEAFPQLAERVRARVAEIGQGELGVYEGFFLDDDGNPLPGALIQSMERAAG